MIITLYLVNNFIDVEYCVKSRNYFSHFTVFDIINVQGKESC